jgi:hypothetical protein
VAATPIDAADDPPEPAAVEVLAPAAFSAPEEISGSIAARATVYDTPVPSVETPVTPVEVPKPKRGRAAASRRSPVASLEKMLRRVQARRQVVSESVA